MTYSLSMVERVLPHVWDTTRYYGFSQAGAPDADMPKGTVDPRKSNSWADALVDVVWACTRLSLGEKRVLYLRFSKGMTVREAGAVLGVDMSTVTRSEHAAVRRLLNILNGEEEGEEWVSWLGLLRNC